VKIEELLREVFKYNFKSDRIKVSPNSKVLIIAGSDSSGGAGIQADIKTALLHLGSYAMTAITAITSQNTTGVKSIVPIPSKRNFKSNFIYSSKDIKPDAIKIGMLHSSKVIQAVINSLKNIKVK
jgi:hydroxymethylpyrimidine/phosphomethylpyrimidine kinase